MDLDLTEAVEAAGRARWERTPLAGRLAWDDLRPAMRHKVLESVALDDLAAAAPLIERQVREQIARDIETYDGPSPWDIGIATKPESIGHWIASEDCALAARIARGGAS